MCYYTRGYNSICVGTIGCWVIGQVLTHWWWLNGSHTHRRVWGRGAVTRRIGFSLKIWENIRACLFLPGIFCTVVSREFT